MIIETVALFDAAENESVDDEIAEITGQFIEVDETRLIDTPFVFSMSCVDVINKAGADGYSTIRTRSGDYTVKIPWKEMTRLYIDYHKEKELLLHG